MKKIITIILVILIIILMICEPQEPQGDLTPYMSDLVYIPQKVSAKGKAKTATGTKCKAGRTIAVDPKIIPYGTAIYINKHKYIAEDCGGAIKGRHIDIYFSMHKECLEFGKQEAEIFKRKKKKLFTSIKSKGETMTWQRNIIGLSLKRTFSRPEL